MEEQVLNQEELVETPEKKEKILELKNVRQYFKVGSGKNRITVKAVHNVSFSVNKGEVFGLVGESGCGKSVTTLCIMQLLPNNGKIQSGSIYLDGTDLTKLSKKEVRKFRGKKMGMIFQEPMTALNNAMENIKPVLETKARRVGGANYQVPIEVRPDRRQTLGLRWLVMFTRKRGERTMAERLAAEAAKIDAKFISDCVEIINYIAALDAAAEEAKKRAARPARQKKEEAPVIQNVAAATTLGDLDALAQLKAQMEKGE